MLEDEVGMEGAIAFVADDLNGLVAVATAVSLGEGVDPRARIGVSREGLQDALGPDVAELQVGDTLGDDKGLDGLQGVREVKIEREVNGIKGVKIKGMKDTDSKGSIRNAQTPNYPSKSKKYDE